MFGKLNIMLKYPFCFVILLYERRTKPWKEVDVESNEFRGSYSSSQQFCSLLSFQHTLLLPEQMLVETFFQCLIFFTSTK